MKRAPIKNERELDAALARVGVLMDRDVDPGTPEGDELERLSLLIRAYEDSRWPIETPTRAKR